MSICTAEANAVLIAVTCDHCCMKTAFIKAILSVSNKPSSCYNFPVKRLSLLTLFLFTHASALPKFSSHCHNVILYTFDFLWLFHGHFYLFLPLFFSMAHSRWSLTPQQWQFRVQHLQLGSLPPAGSAHWPLKGWERSKGQWCKLISGGERGNWVEENI